MIHKRTALVLFVFVAALALSAAANPLPSIGCWWEDPSTTVLGLYGDGDPPMIVTNVTSPDPVHSGDRALRLEDNAATGTPQAYLAYIWGLEDGDVVQAWFYRYDDTPDGAPSCRIWGHWNDELPDNPEGYSGSAGGNSDYGADVGWGLLGHTWTVADGHTGLVIEVRTYSSPGDVVWIDDFEILPPEDCVVQTPEMLVVGTESRTLSDVKALFD